MVGAEVVISVVSDGVGNIRAHLNKRIDRIAVAWLQIAGFRRHGVDFMV